MGASIESGLESAARRPSIFYITSPRELKKDADHFRPSPRSEQVFRGGVWQVGRHVVAGFEKEASQTRDYCVANSATLRAARPDPSRRKERLLRMTINEAK